MHDHVLNGDRFATALDAAQFFSVSESHFMEHIGPQVPRLNVAPSGEEPDFRWHYDNLMNFADANRVE